MWTELETHFGKRSAILAIFQNGLGWPCPVRSALKNTYVLFEDAFLRFLAIFFNSIFRRTNVVFKEFISIVRNHIFYHIGLIYNLT